MIGRTHATAAALTAAALALPAAAQLDRLWDVRFDAGVFLDESTFDATADEAGNLYITGTIGENLDTEALVIKLAPDGAVLWTDFYMHPYGGQELGVRVKLGPNGVLYVAARVQTGSSNGADITLLRYDAETGDLLGATSKPNTSVDDVRDMAVDAHGNAYIAGSLLGDQSDAAVVKFDATGAIRWTYQLDGAGSAPFSNDRFQAIAVAPDGNVVATGDTDRGFGIPDMTTVKLDSATGGLIWRTDYAIRGTDHGDHVVIDDAGDVFVAGVAIDTIDKVNVTKYRGSDGAQLWMTLHAPGQRQTPAGLALGSTGDPYVTASVDPDGDQSNFNNNINTSRLDSGTGAVLWQTSFGSNGVGFFDVPSDIVLDAADNVFITGGADTAPASGDLIMLRYDPDDGAIVDIDAISGDATEFTSGTALALDGEQNILVAGGFRDFNTEEYDILAAKYHALTGGCGGDFNGDGTADTQDVLAYLNAWTAQKDGQCDPQSEDCSADFNGDGVINTQDVLSFLNAWTAGC